MWIINENVSGGLSVQRNGGHCVVLEQIVTVIPIKAIALMCIASCCGQNKNTFYLYNFYVFSK